MNVRSLILSVLALTLSWACTDEVTSTPIETAAVESSAGYGTLTSAPPPEIKKEDLPAPVEDKCIKVQCDDKVDCTKDTCNPETGACQHQPVDALCDEGQKCLASPEGNVAEAGCVACVVNADCNDNNACTTDMCGLTGKCYNDVQGCTDGNSCTEDVCDPAVGCTYVSKGNFAPCDDDGVNKTVDQCIDNVCEHNKYWGVRVKAPVSPFDEYYTQLAVTFPTLKNGKVTSNAWSYGIVKNGYAEVDAYATNDVGCPDCICSAYETMDYPVMFTGLYLSKEKNSEGFSAKQIKIPAMDLKVFAVYNLGFATEFEVPLKTQIVSQEYDTLPWKMKAEAVMAPELKELCEKE